MKQDNPSFSWRDIAKRLELHHTTAKKYFEAWENKLNNPSVKSPELEVVQKEEIKKNDDSDFEDETLEELEEEQEEAD